MSKLEEQSKLWEQITLKRQELNQAYAQDRATSERVLCLSQELDWLLSTYDKALKCDENNLGEW